MSNRRNIQFTYNPHNKATVLDCNFIVDSTNNNGTGVRSLKGSGRVASVYMNTSPAATTVSSVFASGVSVITVNSAQYIYVGQTVTDSTTSGNLTSGTKVLAVDYHLNQVTLSKVTAGASASSPGDTLSSVFTVAAPGNPNPAAGLIVVNLQDNYNSYLGGYSGFVSPVSGTPILIAGSTVMTVGQAYVIVSLGTSTAANWQAVGVPANITPAVGVSFIASVTGGGTGTGAVEAIKSGYSGVDHIEVLGDANQMNSNGAYVLGAGNGMQIIMACLFEGALTAPANNTVIGLNFYMNDSAQGV